MKYLSDAPAHYGARTGYPALSRYVEKKVTGTLVFHPSTYLPFRIIARLSSAFGRHPAWAAEHYYYHVVTRRLQSPGVQHVLCFEAHHEFWRRWKNAPASLVTTLHHPTPQSQSARQLDHLKRASSVIVLSSQNIPYLVEELGIEQVRFIRHGVDIDFFEPAEHHQGPPRLIFIGRVFRNKSMLRRVICRLAEDRPDLRFDLVVPRQSRNTPDLRPLLDHPSVEWHDNISDQALCRLYQEGYLLLMPLDQASANNSIVEAMACGLPVVTTDVGGVRDYGGGTVYPVVANNDDDAMIDLVNNFLEDAGWRDTIARNCREFAEQYLDWKLIAAQHVDFYSEVSGYPLGA